MDGLQNADAVTLRKWIVEGECTAEEATQACLDQIARVNPKVHAYLHVSEETALEAARKVDADRAASKPLGALAGVPVAVKDNICIQHMPATCASRMLEHFMPPFDAHVIEKIKAAGGIIIGKCNLDEFAMGSSTENSAFGPTCNPWDTACIPGGSSGGSAAAVASRTAPLALGSDTGGSIRQPASLCGVVGMKPTYGMVSRYGVVAFASSLDQIGPLARSVPDAALLMDVIAGPDTRDSTSLPDAGGDFLKAVQSPPDPKTLTVGVPREFFEEGLDAEVAKSVQAAIDVYANLGASIKEVSLPHAKYSIGTYYILATAEASSNLARYDGVHYGFRSSEIDDIISLYSQSRKEGFGDEVKRRIMLGTFVLSSGYFDAYYTKAQKVRQLICDDFNKVFDEVDVIVGPASPTPAFKIGEKSSDPLAMYLSDIYTISTNLAGICGICVPCGYTASGLPVGMQLQGQVNDDAKLLQMARIYEQATNWEAVPEIAK